MNAEVVIGVLDFTFDLLGQALSDPRVQKEIQELADETDTEVDDILVEIVLSLLVGTRKTAERQARSDTSSE